MSEEKYEKVSLRVPVGAGYGRAAHNAAFGCAMGFAVEYIDREAGQHRLVGYQYGIYAVACWWTKARTVVASVQVLKEEEVSRA